MIEEGPEAGDLVVLAHGAGGGSDSDFMTHVAERMSHGALRVARFNFPYMEAGRRAPDRAPVLEEAFRSVVEQVGEDKPVLVGGKSMGGRIAAQVVAAGLPARGVFFLGYPLHPPGRPDRLRDAPLLALAAPLLFVQGTRDPFCPLPTLHEVLHRVTAPHQVVAIEDGDHSFKVRGSSGRQTEQAWDEAADAVVRWAGSLPAS